MDDFAAEKCFQAADIEILDVVRVSGFTTGPAGRLSLKPEVPEQPTTQNHIFQTQRCG